MLEYNGYDSYTFHKPRGGTIELTKEYIETIVELAEASNEFRARKKLEELRESSEHWQELYTQLKDSKSNLVQEIKDVLAMHQSGD